MPAVNPMEIIAILAGLVALGLVIAALGASRREIAALRDGLANRPPDPALALLHQQVEALREGMTRTLEASRESVDRRLESTAGVIQQVQRSLGEVNASVRGVTEMTRDIRALQDILRAPKLRGGLGEFFLGDLLSQILPVGSFEMQYGFRSGERVDAVVRAGDRFVPIDAKFPLENFRRVVAADTDETRKRERKAFLADVKRHIDAISTKYIRPDEGTYDFALMYIPAENVYYEVIVRDDDPAAPAGLLPYALERRVIPVSPHSFYAYLQVILIGLQGLKVEARARQIMEGLQVVAREFERFGKEFDQLGTHLRHATVKYEDIDKRRERFAARLDGLADSHALPAHDDLREEA